VLQIKPTAGGRALRYAKKLFEVLAGDEAASAHFEVVEVAATHLVI
jgi:hypothetical protein